LTGVLPVENSLAGSIHRNYDHCCGTSCSSWAKSRFLSHHQLICSPGVTLSDIKKVYSHPQALAQCEHSITRILPRRARGHLRYRRQRQMIKEQNITEWPGWPASRAAAIL